MAFYTLLAIVSTYPDHFEIPRVVQGDYLELLVEMAQDPGLNDWWLKLMNKNPEYARIIAEQAAVLANGNNEEYDHLVKMGILAAALLGNAALRNTIQSAITDSDT